MEKKRSFGAVLVGGWMRLHGLLPLGYHYFWGRVITRLAGRRLRYRRDVVMTNLARSFPDKKYNELRKICDEFYVHFGEIIAEAIWFGARRGERGRKALRRQKLAVIENVEDFNAFYDRCSSVMLLNTHCGNWEVMGGIGQFDPGDPARRGWHEPQVVVLYKKLTSRLWDQVMARNRCAPVLDRGFEGYVESADILRYAVRNRHEKKLYIFNTDQHPYKGAASCDVGEFMHQKTTAMIGGAALACKLDMGVSYIRWRRLSRGHYGLEFVPLTEHASETTPEEIMRRYHALLEEDLNEQPWNYLWTHKRWK